MKRNWELDELIDHFILMPDEQELIQLKRGNTKLGFAVMFKFFQYEARFPHTKGEIPKTVIEYIAKQLEMNPDIFLNMIGPDVPLLIIVRKSVPISDFAKLLCRM